MAKDRRIELKGDSLIETDISYRVALHHLLTPAGWDFDFVGSRQTGISELARSTHGVGRSDPGSGTEREDLRRGQ